MRNKQFEDNFQDAQTAFNPNTSPGSDSVSSGGSGQRKDRTAAHLLEETLSQQEGVNDNSQPTIFSRLRTASLVFAAFIGGITLGINASAVATQAVFHADDRALVIAMDTSPEMLGNVLNAMDVGGSE